MILGPRKTGNWICFNKMWRAPVHGVLMGLASVFQVFTDRVRIWFDRAMKKSARPKQARQISFDLIAPTRPVVGIDEVGRGPLAGPVVAAAIVWPDADQLVGLTDSKQLSEQKREALFKKIMEDADAVGIGQASVAEIDDINIRQATFLAMERAITDLDIVPKTALVDGNALPRLPCPGEAIVGGDSLIAEISAASVVAKVTRDRLMKELSATYPDYGWEKNKGYGTKAHLDALKSHGPTPHHRRSFKPVRLALAA